MITLTDAQLLKTLDEAKVEKEAWRAEGRPIYIIDNVKDGRANIYQVKKSLRSTFADEFCIILEKWELVWTYFESNTDYL